MKENGDSKRSRSRSRSVENSQPQIREASPLKNQTDNNNKDFENDLHEGMEKIYDLTLDWMYLTQILMII